MNNRAKLIAVSIFILFVSVYGASADTLGDNRQFFIRPEYDAKGRTIVNATLRNISERAYFYIEDKYWNELGLVAQADAMARISALANEFDSKIYPQETLFFGQESNPGIDNDPRIVVILAPLVENTGGYYDTSNQFPRDHVPQSNARDMIYLNALALSNESKIFAFLTHEFQHLISFNQKELLRKVDEDIWLNEMRSEYAITHLGYNQNFAGSHLERRVNAFVNEPSDSLTEWKNLPPDYGQIGLFGLYIAEQFSPKVIADTLKTNSSGVISINESLAANGFADKFDDIFARWIAANFLNDTSAHPSLGYKNDDLKNLRLNPSRSFIGLGDNVIYNISDSFKDWQGRWYELSNFTNGQTKALKLKFISPSLTSFKIYYLTFSDWSSISFSSFEPTLKSDSLYIEDLDKINRVAIIPVKKDKLSGFGSKEIPVDLTISAERVVSVPADSHYGSTAKADLFRSSTPATIVSSSPIANYQPPTTNFPDGALIRAQGDPKVYIIKDKWRRHIVSLEIFKFYPHLGFDKVQVVSPEILEQYQESRLVRYPGSRRVYEVDSAARRHWLNMTGDQFIASGRSFDSVFLVNEKELKFYKIGASITVSP